MGIFMFIVEDSPKELVLDAFGLAFLYNLDDLGGDLAFMEEAWDEEFMGRIYGEMRDEEMSMMKMAREERNQKFTPDSIYKFSIALMHVVVILLPVMFVFLE